MVLVNLVSLLCVTVLVTYCVAQQNNVCKTFADYYQNMQANENCYYNPDSDLTVPEIIQRHGYSVEEHTITTNDGYILTMFRIVQTRNSSSTTKGPPVILQHGFLHNSAVFVVRGQKSLGFLLANAGYDVWIGNFRGTLYSKGHKNQDNAHSQYWDFSFHEMGVYDLPAEIDLVWKPAMQFLTNGCLRIRNPERVKQQCLPFPFQMKLCKVLPSIIFGFDYEQDDPETMPVTQLQNSDDVSAKTISHYVQFIETAKFQQYDYGIPMNFLKYGSPVPPLYDLSKINVPVYLMRSENDLMATRKNVERLYNNLPQGVKERPIYTISYDKFSHLDFMSAKDVVQLLYNDLLTFVDSLV